MIRHFQVNHFVQQGNVAQVRPATDVSIQDNDWLLAFSGCAHPVMVLPKPAVEDYGLGESPSEILAIEVEGDARHIGASTHGLPPKGDVHLD
jgi:hypothetical protein